MYEVIGYPEDGTPLIESLINEIKESGNSKNYNDLLRFIQKLKEHGLEMNKNFKTKSFKRLEEDLYELRPTEFRIMFTFHNDKFYLLNGFFKKSTETPKKEIENAKKHIKIIQNTRK